MNALLQAITQIFSSEKIPGTIVTYDNIRQVVTLADKYDLHQVFHQVLLGWLKADMQENDIRVLHLVFAICTLNVKLCEEIVEDKLRSAAKNWSIKQARAVGIDVFWAIRSKHSVPWGKDFRPINWAELLDGLEKL